MANYELAKRTLLHERARRRKRRHWWELLALACVLLFWFLYFAPSALGGPVTYAVVSGHSMEPQLYTGDLVLTRTQPEYKVGDTVLVTVMGGFVIHNIVSVEGDTFKTQGLNIKSEDTWTLPKSAILGKQEFVLKGWGNYLTALRANPLYMGVFASMLTLLLLFDPRKRKVRSKRLIEALLSAKKEIPVVRRNYVTPLLTAMFVLSAVSLLSTGVLLANRAEFYPRLVLSLIGVVISVIAFEVIGNSLLSGGDLSEPYRSLEIFRKRLYLIDESVVIPGQTVPVSKALELLQVAEVGGSPILHLISKDSNAHQFLVVTDDLNYVFKLDLVKENAPHGRHRL